MDAWMAPRCFCLLVVNVFVFVFVFVFVYAALARDLFFVLYAMPSSAYTKASTR